MRREQDPDHDHTDDDHPADDHHRADDAHDTDHHHDHPDGADHPDSAAHHPEHDALDDAERDRRGGHAVSEQVIAGRYVLGDRLGYGGMSTVQLAVDRRLEREVAVKLLAEHLAEDPAFVARFRREALAAARLVHPNIVQVFDFGLDDPTGRHYIVMEFIRGQSGAEILRDRGRIPLEEALAIVAHACRGLDYAHRNGVVHRDVKPGNLLRSEDGVVKLADFGIAKALSDESHITQVGSVLGTAAYLAPEQAHGEEAGPAADLYGLGVVTYQFISGRLPYEASSLTELVLMQQREAPPLLHELVDDVPPQLSAAVDRALALDPGDRYADAEEMRAALVDGARGVGPDPTEATRVADVAETAATSIAPVRPSAAAPPPAQARRLEPRPSRRPPPAAAPPRDAVAPARASRAAGLRRAVAVILILGLVIAGIAVALSSSGGQRQVQLNDVSGTNVHDTVDRLTQLVDDNTR